MVRGAKSILAIYISYYNCLILDELIDSTAACAYFQALFAPRYRVSILGNTARININNPDYGTYPSSNISVTDENAPIAQKAAFLAAYNWYECINPEEIEDEDLI